MKTNKFQQSEKSYSKREKCTVRTIRAWKKQGAPLDDPAEMEKWKAGRRQLPPEALQAQLTKAEKRINRVLRPKQHSTQTQGAAHALGRLEEAEVSAHEAMMRAMESGTPIEIRLARQHWLEVSEALRKFDLIIEANRRDAGELLPREQCEKVLNALWTLLKFAYQSNSQRVASFAHRAPNELEAIISMEELTNKRLLNTMSAMMYPSVGGCFELPLWALKALEGAATQYHGPKAIEWMERRGKALSEWEEFYIQMKENGVLDAKGEFAKSTETKG